MDIKEITAHLRSYPQLLIKFLHTRCTYSSKLYTLLRYSKIFYRVIRPYVPKDISQKEFFSFPNNSLFSLFQLCTLLYTQYHRTAAQSTFAKLQQTGMAVYCCDDDPCFDDANVVMLLLQLL